MTDGGKEKKKPKRRRIPTKAELIQLQKLYRTDERIGERLGGVPAYLVAYWRRKKGVPKHSLPKFSEKEIRTLWERYGDDDRCGLELGISKAAFYNWRRRYGIREKPAFLKLEQLELNFPGMKVPARGSALWNKQSVAQKILARCGGNGGVDVGQEISVEPDLALVHDSAPDVIAEFNKTGSDFVWNTAKILISLAHGECEPSNTTAQRVRQIRDFATRQRLKGVYDRSLGTALQTVLEHGQVLPGLLMMGSDQGIESVGSMAGLGETISEQQMAQLWSDGKVTVTVPGSLRIDITGRRASGVHSKDVGMFLVSRLAEEPTDGRIFEYYGSAISQMTISERFALTHLASAAGARAAICQFDSATRRYLMSRVSTSLEPVVADKNADYESHYQISIERLVPQVAGPNDIHAIHPVAEREGLPLQLVVIGGNANGRFDDLRVAAEVLKGKRIAEECRLVILPASRPTYLEALKKGLIRALSEAGAIIMPPGYACCEATPWVSVADGERCLTTGGRVSAGCFGSEKAEVYVASPATAAASALRGEIADPSGYGK